MSTSFTRRLARRLFWQRLLRISAWQGTLLWAMVAGFLGALATLAFRALLDGLDRLVLGRGGSLVAIAQSLPWWARLLSPVVGGLLAGLLLVLARRLAQRNARQGGPHNEASDYMEAVVLGDGRIPAAQTLVRSTSSLLSIASGGSIGREGSMVQLAALCASMLGQRLRFPVERLRLLVACGAAAGVTAAYNAPIAAAFFIAEIVLGSIAMESVGPILIASVCAHITMQRFGLGAPPYILPAFAEVTGPEVALFALLGLLMGGGAALFLQGMNRSKRLFARLAPPLPLRLALGGLVVGLISIWLPQVWGNGYSVVNQVLQQGDSMGWSWLLLLLAAKMVATFATVGSGAVGGVFTPALFCGCFVGELFGLGVHALWPAASAAPVAYAVTGMGAFLAAATQAPLMAILMIFEMTLRYEVMLPLMACSVVAYFVARSIGAGSMYEITIKRREHGDEKLRLAQLQMRDLVQPTETVVPPDADLETMSRLFLQHRVKYLYVVDAQQRFLGVVPLPALSAHTARAQPPSPASSGSPALPALPPRAADLMTQELRPLTQDMQLGQALQRFMEHHGERLPVIRSAQDPVLLGAADKSTLLATYVRLSESL